MSENNTVTQNTAEKPKNERNQLLLRMASNVKDENTRDYINNRVLKQMEWYSEASRKSKKA